MKKAVILVGGKQYLVAEKETLRVDLLPAGTKELELDALLVIDGAQCGMIFRHCPACFFILALWPTLGDFLICMFLSSILCC